MVTPCWYFCSIDIIIPSLKQKAITIIKIIIAQLPPMIRRNISLLLKSGLINVSFLLFSLSKEHNCTCTIVTILLYQQVTFLDPSKHTFPPSPEFDG